MDKQKQIEEMAEVIENTEWDLYFKDFEDGLNMKEWSIIQAQSLYNAGYRKIPEGGLVLTREEFEKLQALKDDYVKGYEAGVEEG